MKRYYYFSIILGKYKDVVNIGGKIIEIPTNLYNIIYNSYTLENVGKLAKEQLKLSNLDMKNKYYYSNNEKAAFMHKGIVEGVKYDKLNDQIFLSEFSSITSQNIHNINLKQDIVNEKNFDGIEVIKFNYKIPTINVNLLIDKINIKNVSIIKNNVINYSINLNNSNLSKLPNNDFLKLLHEKNNKIMELIKLKDYEFFNFEGKLHMVHKQYILKKDDLILFVDYSKRIPVTFDIYYNICKEISNNSVLNNYLGLDESTKKIFFDIYDLLNNLKKD